MKNIINGTCNQFFDKSKINKVRFSLSVQYICILSSNPFTLI